MAFPPDPGGCLFWECGNPNQDSWRSLFHRDNRGTLDMVLLIINPIHTPYVVGIYWVYPPFKGLQHRAKQLPSRGYQQFHYDSWSLIFVSCYVSGRKVTCWFDKFASWESLSNNLHGAVIWLGERIQTDQLSNEKRGPSCLGYIGDEKLPRYTRIKINHYKDPY